MYKNFQDLLDSLKGQPEVTMAVAAAQDDHALEAVKKAMNEHLVRPILVGDEALIRPLLKEAGLPEDMEIIHAADPAEAAQKAVALVKEGRAQILMKGLVNTAVFLRAVLKSETGLRTGKMLSHLAAFEIPGQKKLLFMTDVALNTYPKLEEKKEILSNAMEALHQLGISQPNVAVLSANETPSDKIPGSVDAKELTAMCEAGELPAGIVEGPLAMDVIASAEAAHHKGIPSRVAGNVDLILVPDIEAGNGIAKAFSHYAGGTMSGILLGAAAPIIVNSRSDSAEGKFASILLALLLQRQEK